MDDGWVFGRFGVDLGSIWGGFGVDLGSIFGLMRVLGGSWAALGSPWAPKIDFSSILRRFRGPSWGPKQIKIDQKSMPRCIKIMHRFSD